MSSTDLEFKRGLQEIRLRPIEVQGKVSQGGGDFDDDKVVVLASTDHDHDDEICRTPTSSDHKIPVMESCPPAPRKRRPVLKCKRRLSEQMEFFEIVGRDEIEAFFARSSLEFSVKGASAPRNIKKRRCTNK